MTSPRRRQEERQDLQEASESRAETEAEDLPDFTPELAHLLLQRVYGDFLHHNGGLHLDRGVSDDAIWHRR